MFHSVGTAKGPGAPYVRINYGVEFASLTPAGDLEILANLQWDRQFGHQMSDAWGEGERALTYVPTGNGWRLVHDAQGPGRHGRWCQTDRCSTDLTEPPP